MSLKSNNVLNKDSYKKAFGKPIEDNQDFHGGYHSIVIRDQPIYSHHKSDRDNNSDFGLGWIKGVSLEPIKFSLNTHWDAMGDAKLPLVGSIMKGLNVVKGFSTIGGGVEIGAHYTSKLLWKKPGYMEISPRFRVIDYYGKGDPLRSIKFLSRFITGDEGARLGDVGGQRLEETGESVDKWFEENVTNRLMGTGALGELTHDGVRTIIPDIAELFEIQGSPPPVSIQIGQWFYLNDMIIPNIRLVFSKEMTSLGPLWVDVTLTMKSRYIMRGLSDIGVLSSPGTFRRESMNVFEVNDNDSEDNRTTHSSNSIQNQSRRVSTPEDRYITLLQDAPASTTSVDNTQNRKLQIEEKANKQVDLSEAEVQEKVSGIIGW
ncbi:MAG: hypothetical protein ACOCZ5_00210 [bacterium]